MLQNTEVHPHAKNNNDVILYIMCIFIKMKFFIKTCNKI